MKLIVLDTETTGFSSDDDTVLEAALSVYDVGTKTVVFSLGGFVHGDVVENPAEEHNHISEAILRASASSEPDGLAFLLSVAKHFLATDDCNHVVAHNAPFDRRMLAAHDAEWDSFTWLDSQRDIEYPSARMSRCMDHLCVDHGINPHSPMRHRAAYDVALLCHLLGQVPDLEQQVVDFAKPRGVFKALVPRERKDEAKSRGFEWKPRIRSWVKTFPLDVETGPTEKRPFRIERIS